MASIVKMIWEKTTLNADEKLVKRLQMIWMPRRLKNAAQEKIGVIISDNILKFHLNDRRKEISEEWRNFIMSS